MSLNLYMHVHQVIYMYMSLNLYMHVHQVIYMYMSLNLYMHVRLQILNCILITIIFLVVQEDRLWVCSVWVCGWVWGGGRGHYIECSNCTCHYNTLCSLSSTLSNWTMEFNRWAPTVIKIAYKVQCSGS